MKVRWCPNKKCTNASCSHKVDGEEARWCHAHCVSIDEIEESITFQFCEDGIEMTVGNFLEDARVVFLATYVVVVV